MAWGRLVLLFGATTGAITHTTAGRVIGGAIVNREAGNVAADVGSIFAGGVPLLTGGSSLAAKTIGAVGEVGELSEGAIAGAQFVSRAAQAASKVPWSTPAEAAPAHMEPFGGELAPISGEAHGTGRVKINVPPGVGQTSSPKFQEVPLNRQTQNQPASSI